MDNRKYDTTNKIFAILNEVKGFDVAMQNPSQGVIIVKHNGVSFYLSLDPIFNDNEEGRKAEETSFDDIVKFHKWVFKNKQ